ncbi:hypothetical protein [Desulfovibrio subterraneus]|uniref:Uncharacterized protein n=1 Tax=Desulfovibrio subterraneus TaxID=2718620 RepID=A0A7J0BKE3_9BACT|nr:hypothetical protein [Desulfovibrio subterraneus]GFM34048.1 hypothetical protein DSM101010T_24130 [Desulfovibrio subterraneus]
MINELIEKLKLLDESTDSVEIEKCIAHFSEQEKIVHGHIGFLFIYSLLLIIPTISEIYNIEVITKLGTITSGMIKAFFAIANILYPFIFTFTTTTVNAIIPFSALQTYTRGKLSKATASYLINENKINPYYTGSIFLSIYRKNEKIRKFSAILTLFFTFFPLLVVFILPVISLFVSTKSTCNTLTQPYSALYATSALILASYSTIHLLISTITALKISEKLKSKTKN